MVIGTHIILTGYGHWLPNDPRGSQSHQVYSPEIVKLGDVHHGRREVQPTHEELREFHEKARGALKHTLRWFSPNNRATMVCAFNQVIFEAQLTCYACAILTSHVHILVQRHGIPAQQISQMLKEAGRQALRRANFPQDHPVFSADCCNYFKSSVDKMWECVTYINENFDKHGLPRERYPFIVDYDGWTPW